MATEKDEIRELKALVEELQAQVLSAGDRVGAWRWRLAGGQLAVASPEVAAQGDRAAAAAATTGYVRPVHGRT